MQLMQIHVLHKQIWKAVWEIVQSKLIGNNQGPSISDGNYNSLPECLNHFWDLSGKLARIQQFPAEQFQCHATRTHKEAAHIFCALTCISCRVYELPDTVQPILHKLSICSFYHTLVKGFDNVRMTKTKSYQWIPRANIHPIWVYYVNYLTLN